MKRIIHKIRQQSPELRMLVAVLAAFAITSVIAAFWIASLSQGAPRRKDPDTPGPLTSLVSSIKGLVRTTTNEHPSPLKPQNQVQVIDGSTTQ